MKRKSTLTGAMIRKFRNTLRMEQKQFAEAIARPPFGAITANTAYRLEHSYYAPSLETEFMIRKFAEQHGYDRFPPSNDPVLEFMLSK